MRFPLVARSHHEEVVAELRRELKEKDALNQQLMVYIGIVPQAQEQVAEVAVTSDKLASHGYRRLSQIKAQAARKMVENYREKNFGVVNADIAQAEAEGRNSVRG